MVFLTVKVVQGKLGISRTKIYKLLKEGVIPSCRIGSSIRIRQTDLDLYISTGEWK